MALLVSLSMVSCGAGDTLAPVGKPSPATKPAPHGPDNGKTASPDQRPGPPPPPVDRGIANAAPEPPVAPAPRADNARTTAAASVQPPPQPRVDPAAAQAAARSDLLFELTILRSQIEQYNAENPRKAYDGRTPLDTFWHALIQGTYLLAAPINPLQKSATVARSPAPGTGWVWATRLGVMGLYAVDENGGWLDESPGAGKESGPGRSAALAAQKTTRESLGAVRSALLDFYDQKVRETGGQGRWPTLAELRGGSVLPGGIPKNPYNHSQKIAPATSRQAQSRAIVGSGEGWAYYDGSGGSQPVFYANTRVVGQNIW